MNAISSIGDPQAWRKLAGLVRERLSWQRRRHSFGVAHLSKELCERYGLSPGLGVLAGLGHDIARELPAEQVLHLAETDGRPISRLERERPILLHGRAGAVLLQREAGLGQEDVLEAVRNHTTGRPGMGLLSRIIFAADFLEPTRTFVDGEFRREALNRGLDDMLRMVVERVFGYLRAEGRPIAPQGEALCRELEERIRSGQKKER